jgi:tRNA(Ile2) C34 agmatinyltransferase TiaS
MNILCIFCAVEMTEKTVFGKDVYDCPKCGRRVAAADIIELPEAEPATTT